METLNESRTKVKIGMSNGGVTCPCCNQFCKVYKRKLNSNMACFLCKLVAWWTRHGVPAHHSKLRYEHYGRDYPYLVAWGFMTDTPNDDSSKRRSGLWTPTERGAHFAHGQISVRQYALVYNGKVLEYEGDLVTIHDALGDAFDYKELMRCE